MRELVDRIFEDVFITFSTMGQVKDFYKENPGLGHDETYYTMRLNNCVNRTSNHLKQIQEVANINEPILTIPMELNAMDYISKFLEHGEDKRQQIADALASFAQVANAEENVTEKAQAIHKYAIEADGYAKELRQSGNS